MFSTFDRRTALRPGQGWRLAVLAALPCAGLLGGPDPIGFLAWATLLAPGLGVLAGGFGLGLLYGGLVPAVLTLGLVWTDALSPTDLPTPLYASLFQAGLFFLGMGLGRLAPRHAPALAGATVLLGLLLVGLPVQGGFGGGGEPWARSHPGLARGLLELSPLVVAYDCAGLDWTHGHGGMYELSGVEWFGRRASRGILAGPLSLLVGCAFVVLARRLRPEVDPGRA